LELGERDLAGNVATVVRRDKAFKEAGQKTTVALDALVPNLRDLLIEIQVSLLDQARQFLVQHTFAPASREEFYELCRTRAGMVDIPWCGLAACEAHVKDETTATTRNLRANPSGPACLACGEPATVQAYFAQSY
jgi:prolyl-tRNA synthetase